MSDSKRVPTVPAALLPTQDVLSRLLALYGHDGQFVEGTGTLIVHGGKEYIATASHVFKIGRPDALLIAHEGQPKLFPVRVVGHDQEKDISVVASTFPHVTRDIHLQSGETGFCLGQDVVCLGYAHGLLANDEVAIHAGHPDPLCTRGSIAFADMSEDSFLVDRHAAGGMSGGMVAYRHIETHEWQMLGIVIGSTYEEREVNNQRVLWPSGFTRVAGVRSIRKIIESNPVGCPIKPLNNTSSDREATTETSI